MSSAESDITDLEDNVMTTNETWVVDASGAGDFATLGEAMAAARQIAIRDSARLTITVEDGTYTSSTTLSLNHDNGDRISIIGNTSDPSKVVLEYTGTAYSIGLSTGNYLYTFKGFTLKGSGSGYGIQVSQGAWGWFGNLVVDNFHRGIYLTGSSGAYFSTGTVVVKNSGQYGLFVRGLSYAVANELDVSDSAHSAIIATENSVADVYRSTVSDSTNYGIASQYGAYVNARYAESSSNGSYGFYTFMANLYARESKSSSNASHGYFADVGNLYAYLSEADGNGGYGFAVDRMAHINARSTTYTTANSSGMYHIPAATGDQISRNIEQ